MHEKYQEALEAHNKIIKWKDSLQASSIPETLPMYSDERRIRDRQLLDVGMETIEDVLKTQEKITTSSTEVWRSTENLLSLFKWTP
jgi:hypothetical protein